MKPGTRLHLVALWYGTALASLFFYPLLRAIDGDIYYLLWQPEHSQEFGVAFGLLALLLAGAWRGLDRLVSSPRLQLVGTVLLALIPLTSFAVATVRQMPIKETLIPLMAAPGVRLWLAIGLGAVAILVLATVPGRALKAVRGGLLVMSPVSLIVAMTFLRLGGYHQDSPISVTATRVVAQSGNRSSTFVFLFDELSYRFVYADGVVRPDLPHLRRLSDRATNYAAASAPGDETITSIPGLLAGRRFFDVDAEGDAIYEVLPDNRRVPLDLLGRDSLFVQARAAGFRTEVVGYYLPYCRLLTGAVDACRAFSFYNYSTIAGGFSPVNPVLTTLILWPYQPPFGMLKVPAFNRLQRGILSKTMEAAIGDLEPDTRQFRLIHFPVPHLPFVFDRDGYNPADDPMRKDAENYTRQLEYVDTIAGVLLGALDKAGVLESSTVVIMSDHEYRWPQKVKSEAAHIPLIVKHLGQSTRQVVTDPVRAEQVLARLITGR